MALELLSTCGMIPDTQGKDALMGMRRQTRVAATAGLSAGARLMRLELLAMRQAQGLRIAEGQITKLNTRARLLGKDIQPPLRQAWPPLLMFLPTVCMRVSLLLD